MTDIVERLREYQPEMSFVDVVYEAADEIERLRMGLLDATTVSEARQIEIERLRASNSDLLAENKWRSDKISAQAQEIERRRQHAEIVINTLGVQDAKIERYYKALQKIAFGHRIASVEIARAALAEDAKGNHDDATKDHAPEPSVGPSTPPIKTP